LTAAAVLCSAGFHAAAARAADSAAAAADFYGAWQSVQAYNLLKTSDGKLPPLTGAARKVYQKNIALRSHAKLAFDGVATLCHPPGIPRVLTRAPFWILPTDGEVVFLSEWNNLKWSAKIGAKPTERDDVYYLGNNVGTWDGEVLVIDSGHFRDNTLLDDALPHSESLHVTERLRLIDHDALEDTLTIADPETFTAPWTTVLRFTRLPSSRQYPEDVCMDRTVTPLNVRAE
jgi:hypothetical protein